MNTEIRLSETERELLQAMLERELEDLHVEIHHAQVNAMRDQLKERREVVRHLLDRLQPAAVA